jgi:hypothetical protein
MVVNGGGWSIPPSLVGKARQTATLPPWRLFSFSMSLSTVTVGRRCGLRLRPDGAGRGKATEKQLCREFDAAFRRWETRQPPTILKKLRQPEKVI